MTKIAILDDYQQVALKLADWSSVIDRADVVAFADHLADEHALIERLLPFEVLCAMRERTPLTRSLIERLPNLKMVASTGAANASIDKAALEERGIRLTMTGYSSTAAIELTWALILAIVRHVVPEAVSVRAGGWQVRVGTELEGRTLSVLGVGRIGSRVARIGQAFGMRVIGWSPNLTAERAQEAGVTAVSREVLFAQADILTIHMILGRRTRGLVGSEDLARMKPSAYLINTSRGPLIDEQALIHRLADRRIAGAALDVFDQEPLPSDHPFRRLDNVLATPHVGYVAEDLYRTFYGDAVHHIATWLDDQGDDQGIA